MTNDLDKFIHEEVMGKCIEHDYEKVSYKKAQIGVGMFLWVCQKCDHSGGVAEWTIFRQGVPYQEKYSKLKEYVPNYLEHNEHWGELITWVMEQSWWRDFKYWLWGTVYNKPFPFHGSLPEEVIANPRSLPEHIAEYLKREVGR